MFRLAAKRISSAVSTTLRANARLTPSVSSVRFGHDKKETDEEFDARYVAFLERPDIDGWELRKVINELQGYDLVPEPKIVIAALKACRRLNEYALTIRVLEVTKEKCGSSENEIWPYMMSQIQPTLTELGVCTLEEMGYDQPELAVKDVYDM